MKVAGNPQILSVFGGCVLAVVCGLSTPSQAQIVPLVDNNSAVQIDTASQNGMFSWMVDGIPVLHQQWFWYRIGGVGPASAINTLSAPSILPTSPSAVGVTYAGQLLNVNVKYSLAGGNAGSGVSDVSEQLSINNISSTTLDLHFFQYSDFRLGNTPNSVMLGRNIRGLFNEADQSDSTGTALSETVISPGANHGEAALLGQTLAEFGSASFTTLNDNTTAGPGQTTWAFEWDVSLAPGGSLLIGKDKRVDVSPLIPEPSTFALVSFGLIAFGISRRRPVA